MRAQLLLASPKRVGATAPCPKDRRISGKLPSAQHVWRRLSLWRRRSSGPCVPMTRALGPLAVHRWLYHPRCARCFAPFTTAGSIRASTLQIVEVRPAQVRKHLHALARPYPASVAFRVKSASEYPQLPVQGGRKQGRRAQAAPSGLPARRGRAARSHFEARQGRPRPRLARPVVSRAHSVGVAQLI